MKVKKDWRIDHLPDKLMRWDGTALAVIVACTCACLRRDATEGRAAGAVASLTRDPPIACWGTLTVAVGARTEEEGGNRRGTRESDGGESSGGEPENFFCYLRTSLWCCEGEGASVKISPWAEFKIAEKQHIATKRKVFLYGFFFFI